MLNAKVQGLRDRTEAKPDRQKERETERKIKNRQPKASSHAELVKEVMQG